MRGVKDQPRRVIHLHPLAPPKPAWGAPCNGCGLCCAAEPCPLGMLVSRRRRGRCAALLWSDAQQRHLCGMVTEPHRHWPAARWLPAAGLRRLARRWIAAQQGCDSDLEPA
jgi:Fe-S-cluster-containing hydrogenase component 2